MRRKSLATVGFAAVMTLAVQNAKADFVLTLDDLAGGGIEVIVADNVGANVFLPDSGLTTTHADSAGELGVINFEGAIGSFPFGTVTGQSKPFLAGSPPRMRLSANVVSDDTGSMTLSLTDTEFSSALPFDVDGSIGGVTDGTVLYEWGADLGNGHFSFASGSGSLGPFGPGAFGDASSFGPLDPDPSLSLSNSVTVTHPGGSSVTSFSSSVIIPEPGAALLLIAALPILLRRR